MSVDQIRPCFRTGNQLRRGHQDDALCGQRRNSRAQYGKCAAMRMSDRQRGAMPLRLSQQFVELCVDCCGLRVVIEKHPSSRCRQTVRAGNRIGHAARTCIRSEEHTSELQSLMRISYAVFCLKKKTTYT